DYIRYKGGICDPALVFVDEDNMIFSVVHVHQALVGYVEGVQSVKKIENTFDTGFTKPDEFSTFLPAFTYGGMFILGIVTSFSPCCVAMLFLVVSYLLSDAKKKPGDPKRNTKGNTVFGIFFMLSMGLVFLVFGIGLSSIGTFVAHSLAVQVLGGIIIIILGFNVIFQMHEKIASAIEGRFFPQSGQFKDNLLRQVKSTFGDNKMVSGFVLGMLMSVLMAPCAFALVAPIFVWTVFSTSSILQGGIMLFFFGLGHGFVVVPIAMGIDEFKQMLTSKVMDKLNRLMPFFGVVIIIVGIYYITSSLGISCC
ncbi:MAG TPA: hypothetical protein ENN76_02190, partial [Euryarchaeota archaeon]|nr:hypothetical protein [Euryarchaeota archaeon]